MKKSFLATIIVLATATAAQAGIISFSLSPYGPLPAAFGPAVIGTLPKFDPGLGTLTKVTLSLDSTTSAGSIAWDNEAGVPSTVTLGIGAEVEVTALSALAATAVPLQTGSSSVTADEVSDGTGDFAGPDSFSVTGGTGTDSDTDVSTAPATLALFTAAFFGETFDVNLESSTQTSLSTNGGFGPIDPEPGETDGEVTVTYEYTEIPEPGTCALFGLGGLALLARRRR